MPIAFPSAGLMAPDRSPFGRSCERRERARDERWLRHAKASGREKTHHLNSRPITPQQPHVIAHQTGDRAQKGEAEHCNDEASCYVPPASPCLAILSEGMSTSNVPGREGECVDGAEDGGDEEGDEGGVVAAADALWERRSGRSIDIDINQSSRC